MELSFQEWLLFQEGFGQTALSRMFKVGITTIYQVIRRKSWKHIKEE